MTLNIGFELNRMKGKEKGEINSFPGALLLVPFKDV